VGINREITISSQTCASSLIYRHFKPATRTPLLVMLFFVFNQIKTCEILISIVYIYRIIMGRKYFSIKVLIVRVPICSTSFRNSQISYELFVSFSFEHPLRVLIDFKYNNICTYSTLLYIQFNRELQITHPIVCEKKRTFVKCNETLTYIYILLSRCE
jgi:hypothetical protein